jgi:DMSO/TMAO reductase YedYZ molybdopterin-dependent catalytic subunit
VTTTEQPPAPASGAPARPAPRRAAAALAGMLAAAVALGIAELVAALIGPAASPVVAVGDVVITLAPEPVKSFAISTFGEQDKLALVVGTLVLVGLAAAGLGLLGLRAPRAAAVGIGLFGLLGAVAAVSRPAGSPLDGLPALVGAGAGMVALRLLLARLQPPHQDSDGGATESADRRRFVLAGGVALGVAVVAGGGGRLVQELRFDVADARRDLRLPRPSSPAPRLPSGADLAAEVEGLTPLFTGNRAFYRVDTAITVPQIRPRDFRLDVTGMVDRPRTWTLAELFDRDDVMERDITLTCVSNEVGGGLAGTARWLGVPLGAVLRESGIRRDSTQLVCRSSDGMTIGAPTRPALEVDDAMLAFGMNGEPLPVEHGFPVRMIIPGLYGYVSACKWLTGIEASTFDAFDAYWVARGWAAEGPVKIASRIDTPSSGRTFAAGRRAIAGVAWAQTRGIARVEVRIDDGDWMAADLSPEVDADLWRQWVLRHDFEPGSYLLSVRATGADGEVQPGERAAPFPDGASGWHTIRVVAR